MWRDMHKADASGSCSLGEIYQLDFAINFTKEQKLARRIETYAGYKAAILVNCYAALRVKIPLTQ